MRLIIRDLLEVQRIANQYKIVTECSHGDNDALTMQEAFIPEDDIASIIKIVKYFKYINNKNTHKVIRKIDDIKKHLTKLLPNDITAKTETESNLINWYITYFNEDGLEFAVELEHNEEDLIKGEILDASEIDFLKKQDWYKDKLSVEESILLCKNDIIAKNMNVKKRSKLIEVMSISTNTKLSCVDFFNKFV